MLKKLVYILMLLSAFTAIIWSSQYIYQKQQKSENFYSFLVSDSADILFIPNNNNFIKKDFNLSEIKAIQANQTLQSFFGYSAQLKDFNFNFLISKSTFVSFDAKDISIVFNNFYLSPSEIEHHLKEKLGITSNFSDDKLTLEQSELYFLKKQDFFAISTKPIQPNPNKLVLNNQGNYLLFHQQNAWATPTYYQTNQDNFFSFEIDTSENLKGKGKNTKTYFKAIPANFDTAFFYASTRFTEDAKTILQSKDSSDFLNWVDESFMHLKKGNMEIIIGRQNDQQYLKNILDEQTIELSEDSLLPPPIFKNNYEIHFFKSYYHWQDILPNTKGDFLIFTEINDLNVLANSNEAMDWYIKEMQLGNDLFSKNKNLSLPNKCNYMKIIRQNNQFKIQTKNRILNQKNLVSTIISSEQNHAHVGKIKLMSSFFTPISVDYLTAVKPKTDSLIILAYSKKGGLISYDKTGKKLWKMTKKLIQNPQIVHADSAVFALIFESNKIDLIHMSTGQSKKGFPVVTNGNISTGKLIKYADNSNQRILINENNTVINYSLDGKQVDGWQFKAKVNLKSEFYYHSENQKDYIYFKDSFDSLHILNRKGEHRFKQNIYSKIENASPYLTGDITKENLRILSFQNPYIKSQFMNDGHFDSLQINLNVNPTNISWLKRNNNVFLVIEEYNKIFILNEFGILESEIQKPQPNLSYIKQKNTPNELHIFGNLANNHLYLLNKFGKLLNSKPIFGNESSFIFENILVSYYDSNIYVYQIN
ncbi:MAG: hypothetical protein ACWA41_01390 [Putridiphycobacter sp.]